MVCVWTVPQDELVFLQSSLSCSEEWWDEDVGGKVRTTSGCSLLGGAGAGQKAASGLGRQR